MTIAEIYGKISSSGSNISDRSEDLLTSDVFGCLRYIPFKEGFQKILAQAQRRTDSERLSITSTNNGVKVHFWPRLENNSEPDVLIRFGDHLIIIEVKYLSGKSGHYGANQENENNLEAASSDQLARLFQGLMSDKGNCPKRSLIYLTAHRVLPNNDIKAGYEALDKLSDDSRHKYNDNVYWLSWFEVYKTISGLLKEDIQLRDKCWRFVLCDIQRLLHRKGLRQFEGFDRIICERTLITAFYKRKPKRITFNVEPVGTIKQPVFYRPNLIERGNIMNNEAIKPEILSENIKISFDNIANVYEESSLLLKDLAAELEKLGHEKAPTGNTIGTTDLKRDMNSPRYWLVRYAALLFWPSNEPKNRLLSFCISYFDLAPRAMKPYLIVGVGEMYKSDYWHYWWMYSAFLNENKMFEYYGPDNKKLNIVSPEREWQHQVEEWGFEVPDVKNSPSYPKAGKLFAVPLSEIKSEDVGKLAERGLKLWNTKFTWNSDSQ